MKKLTPIKAIRAKCLDCCAAQPHEVRLCLSTNCPIHSYRMGKRPKNPQIPLRKIENKPIQTDSQDLESSQEVQHG